MWARMRGGWMVLVAVMLMTRIAAAGDRPSSPGDRLLRQRLAAARVAPLPPPPAQTAAKVRLGQALFFDKILSGNRDIACATCHHPALMTQDALTLSIGTGGVGLGPERVLNPTRPFVARNALDVFNRGATQWTTMFWDSRVAVVAPGQFRTPAGSQLPAGLDSVLAAQALFPLTGRAEMLGNAGDPGNELALHADSDFTGIWDGVTARLMAIPAYRWLFAAAYPDAAPASLDIVHAANAIAAFEAAAFDKADSPFDRYLAGDDRAMDVAAKRGALLFYGRAGCVQCHAGNLLTDQAGHALAVPQLGPGKPPSPPQDFGCGAVPGEPAGRYAFRTPPLRNVAVTGPWMHDGAYATLAGAVRHHLAPARSLLAYDRAQLPPLLQPTVLDDPGSLQALIAALDPALRRGPVLSDGAMADLLAFLEALTSESLGTLPAVVPDAVPSGLPVDRPAESGG